MGTDEVKHTAKKGQPDLRLASATVNGTAEVLAEDKTGRWHYATDAVGFSDVGAFLGAGFERMPRLARNLPPVEDEAAIQFLPVIPDPPRIFCVGYNYPSDGLVKPEHPTLFLRTSHSITGHLRDLVKPTVSEQFDWEGELAFVIGRRGRHISAENAESHIAGYTCFLDGTIRDFAKHGTQATAGKNFDRTGALGPALTLIDRAPPLDSMQLETRVNHRIVQSAGISTMFFPPGELIAYLSQFTEMLVGDVVATGTPPGIGIKRDPPQFLMDGDTVEISVSGIGTLSNTVRSE